MIFNWDADQIFKYFMELEIWMSPHCDKCVCVCVCASVCRCQFTLKATKFECSERLRNKTGQSEKCSSNATIHTHTHTDTHSTHTTAGECSVAIITITTTMSRKTNSEMPRVKIKAKNTKRNDKVDTMKLLDRQIYYNWIEFPPTAAAPTTTIATTTTTTTATAISDKLV